MSNTFPLRKAHITLLSLLLLPPCWASNSQDKEQELFTAIWNDDANRVVRLLTNNPTLNVNAEVSGLGITPLHRACPRGNKTIVETLLNHGANKNAVNIYMDTPLHLAVKGGNLDIVQLVITDYNKNLPNDRLNTPLHVALQSDKKDIAQYLIEQGTDLNRRDKHGNTPFFIITAKKTLEGGDGEYEALYNLCLTKKANPHIPNHTGSNVSILAPSNQDNTPPDSTLRTIALFKCLEVIICYLFYKYLTPTNRHQTTPKPSHKATPRRNKHQRREQNNTNQPNPAHQDTTPHP